MRSLSAFVMAASCCLTGAQAQEAIYSGPQPGEEITPFDVIQVNTPDDVVKMQYAKTKSTGPTMICFLHRISEPAIGLLITLEAFTSRYENFTNHFVVLPDDKETTEALLKRWANRPFFAKAKMSMSTDGIEGPGDYGLNRNITATVLVVNENKVVKNFAYQDPSYRDAQEILSAVTELLGGEEPDVDHLRKQIRARRDKQRRNQMTKNPVFKLAPDSKIGEIMLLMLRTEGDRQENATLRSKQMLQWVGEDKQKLASLREYCRAILDGKFEMNEASRKALIELAQKK